MNEFLRHWSARWPALAFAAPAVLLGLCLVGLATLAGQLQSRTTLALACGASALAGVAAGWGIRPARALPARAAGCDPVTGLPGYRLFRDRLTAALAHGERHGELMALCVVRVGSLAACNALHGRAGGDQLLCGVATGLRHALQRRDDLLGRCGADSFAILLRSLCAPEAAARTVTRVLAALEAPVLVTGSPLPAKASCGVALFPVDAGAAAELLKKAALAGGAAGELATGGLRFYDSALQARVAERLWLEQGLRRALVGEELLLEFQPKVAAATGRTTGLEALVRWQHPQLGRLAPDRFLEVAQRGGLMAPLTDWVLERVCRQLAAWHAAGEVLVPVAVNVAPPLLAATGFVDRVEACLAAAGVPPCYLQLEVTETVLLDATGAAPLALDRLTRLGVAVHLDDFGTGYSSLAYLQRRLFSTLKIDRAFVRDLERSPAAAAIAAAIVTLAQTLKLGVVAEGVETPGQAAFLKGIDCQELQGFHIARPLPAAAVPAFVAGRGVCA